MDKNTKDRVLVEDLFDDFYTQLDASDIFSISDIYVRLDLPQGDLSISDEDETCTVHKTIYHWCVEKPENIDEVEKTAINTIRATLLVMQNKGYFDRPAFQLPISVLYQAPGDAAPTELLQIGDEWMGLDLPLMEGLDKELDSFLTNLMKEQ
ncbi:hypothetical protein [Porphyromonas cangingivalis]|uniref:hypothetical protein n=1 Tax=Porphyromonas cangingivalis TaxID=36874 RepID=UPI00051DEA5D|nr:hypothetical protein [Porphyromonas cangingivalis]KGL47941.1 hypothetical protein HQ34_08160 [Porphyromonas cangingivalis]